MALYYFSDHLKCNNVGIPLVVHPFTMEGPSSITGWGKRLCKPHNMAKNKRKKFKNKKQ